MRRSAKATSVSGAVQAMQNVLAPPLPPPWPLSSDQEAIWNEILMRRSRDEWQPIDLRFAWELSQVIVRLREEEAQLIEEKSIIPSERGGSRVNPRSQIVHALSRRAVLLAQYLRIHPGSDALEPTQVIAGRKVEREARANVVSLAGADFLPID